LAVVSRLAPLGVIAILLSPASIAPGRLQMSARFRTDPYVGICRRDREAANAFERASMMNGLAIRPEIPKSLAGARASNPRLGIRHVEQSTFAGVPLRANDDLRNPARLAGGLIAH